MVDPQFCHVLQSEDHLRVQRKASSAGHGVLIAHPSSSSSSPVKVLGLARCKLKLLTPTHTGPSIRRRKTHQVWPAIY